MYNFIVLDFVEASIDFLFVGAFVVAAVVDVAPHLAALAVVLLLFCWSVLLER